MKIRIKLYYILITFLMMIGVVFAEVISKDPNYIKDRGYAGGVKFNKVHIANYQKKELKNHNYTIIKDRKEALEVIFKKYKNKIIVILGKGRDDYQIVGDEKHYYSDIAIVEKFLDEN